MTKDSNEQAMSSETLKPADEGLAGELADHCQDYENMSDCSSEALALFAYENSNAILSALRTDHTALREAWAKRAGTTEVTEWGELPYLKIYFNDKADMHAFDDAIRQALAIEQEG